MVLIPTNFYDFLYFLSAESGGIIAIESSGEYSMEFNSKGMFRAVCKWWYITIPFVDKKNTKSYKYVGMRIITEELY